MQMRTPIFSEAAPVAWFAVVEAQFDIQGIKHNNIKFLHVLSALPVEVVNRLPPSVIIKKNYELLRTSIISAHEKTKPELLEKLMESANMSGRPSVYLHEMCMTAAKLGVGDELIRHKFIQACPKSIGPILASQKTLNVEQLGHLADELVPFSDKSESCNTISQPNASKWNNYFARPPWQPSNSNELPIGLRPFHSQQKPLVCRGHLYYSTTSRSCKPWCKWPSKEGCQMYNSSRVVSRESSPQRNKDSEN
jgi:hypothetical protein